MGKLHIDRKKGPGVTGILHLLSYGIRKDPETKGCGEIRHPESTSIEKGVGGVTQSIPNEDMGGANQVSDRFPIELAFPGYSAAPLDSACKSGDSRRPCYRRRLK